MKLETRNLKLGSTQWKNIIRDGAGVVPGSQFMISDSQAEQFAVHATELLRWNQKINLTAIKDPFEVAVKHYIDSLAPAPAIPAGASLLDIGSGGGFPGIPLKILMPSLSVTLIDSSRKKINFQKHVIRILGLKKIDAVHIRAEELAMKEAFANAFDVVVCRAFSSLDSFISLALPLVAEQGTIIALKGKTAEAETESACSQSSEVFRTLDSSEIKSKDDLSLVLKKYTLPYIDARRTMVLIQREMPL
ncbi:MAG: 16S rRNA (guanine(527)-N(7))-methyltransferase RsmG [Desulfobacterales bacterium]|nr:16S rRNA (guanine(527)-N(7))-methyltransferase RsmG [Desulfobacterales bacterium]